MSDETLNEPQTPENVEDSGATEAEVTSAAVQEPVLEIPAEALPVTKAVGKHTQVVLQAGVIDEIPATLKLPGELLLSNHTRKELGIWYTKLLNQVSDNQTARNKLTEKELEKGKWLRWSIDENNSLLVTPTEVEMLETLIIANKSLGKGMEERYLMTESAAATNVPGHTPTNPRMQGVMHAPPVHDVKDPVQRVRRQLGLSVARWVPLMTSGFRIELEGANNMELLNLDTKLIIDKIDTSANSYGYSLSSANCFMDRALIDFILDHVTSNTAWNMSKNELLNNIALTDYDQLVIGMASTIFPDGYPIERAVFREKYPDGVVSNTVRKRLNIQRMAVTRWEYLTESQKANIYTGKHNGNVAEITERLAKHRDTIREDIPHFVELNNGVVVKLHIPTLAEFLRIGVKFQTGLEDHVRKVLSMEASAKERESYLARASEITRVMYLSHWVEGIYTKDPETGEMIPSIQRVKDLTESAEVIDKADEGIRTILEDLAVFEHIAEKLMDEISLFINKTKLSFAIVTREPNTVVEPGEHPSVVVIDPAEVFFTLLRHKILMAGG